MAITTFAAIDVGSYEVSMKIYELSKKYGIKEVNYLRYRMELGKDAYARGKIGSALTEELCKVIKAYVETMREYRASDYRACATSGLRELKNPYIVIEQVYQRTGIRIEVLNNAEQRFLSYKSIAAMENDFQEIIQKRTAILDVGGGSTQISLFDKDALVSTQNLKLGILRVRELLRTLEKNTIHYDRLVEETIHSNILDYKRMYLKDRNIQNVILIGDFFMDTIFHGRDTRKVMRREELDVRYDKIIHMSPSTRIEQLEIPPEYSSLVIPTLVLYKQFIDAFGAEMLWAPGTILADGIAYDYGEKHKIIRTTHNFENDIVVAARNIGKRYNSDKPHIQNVSKVGLAIFDGIKKSQGLNARARLLLQSAILLHDCGKYISMRNVGECSYSIIMATEIIGLSHVEREIIANVVKYNGNSFDYFSQIARQTGLREMDYLLVAKLTAILRIANAMDRSHYQKVSDLRVAVKGQELVITVDGSGDLLLDTGLMKEKADFFEEVYGIRPVIRKKRRI